MIDKLKAKIEECKKEFETFKKMEERPEDLDMKQKFIDYSILRHKLIWYESPKKVKQNVDEYCEHEAEGSIYDAFLSLHQRECLTRDDHDSDCESEDCSDEHEAEIEKSDQDAMFGCIDVILDDLEHVFERAEREMNWENPVKRVKR